MKSQWISSLSSKAAFLQIHLHTRKWTFLLVQLLRIEDDIDFAQSSPENISLSAHSATQVKVQ